MPIVYTYDIKSLCIHICTIAISVRVSERTSAAADRDPPGQLERAHACGLLNGCNCHDRDGGVKRSCMQCLQYPCQAVLRDCITIDGRVRQLYEWRLVKVRRVKNATAEYLRSISTLNAGTFVLRTVRLPAGFGRLVIV